MAEKSKDALSDQEFAAESAAASPPPQYKPKRTPSQEEIYIRELKAWATEREKMYPGAYGEYFGKVTDPSHIPRYRYDDWHRFGGQNHTFGGISRAERDQETDADIRELHRPLHTVEPLQRRDDEMARRDSLGESSGAGMESSSAPKEGSVKRRLSNFMKKFGKGDDELGSERNGNHGDFCPELVDSEDDAVADYVSELPERHEQ